MWGIPSPCKGILILLLSEKVCGRYSRPHGSRLVEIFAGRLCPRRDYHAGGGRARRMSPKFPEVFIQRRTLVFAGKQAAYPTSAEHPTSAEQQCRGPPVLRGLCAPSLRSSSPRPHPWISRRGPTLAPAPHSFASASPPHGTNLSRISTQDPGQTFPSGLLHSHTRSLFPGGGGATELTAAPGSLRGPPATRFPRSPRAHPRLRTPDLGLPRPRSGKPRRLMRPGCFRFAFAPFSPQLGRLWKNKVGEGGPLVKSACPDKVVGTLRFGLKRGRGRERLRLRPGTPVPCRGGKNQETLASFRHAKKRDLQILMQQNWRLNEFAFLGGLCLSNIDE